jgi:anthranilate synthase/aminodeoxychorismate synthase-like glutamine amidotransferase
VIVVVDNFDSFVHNLARLLRLAGAQTRVVRADAVRWEDLAAMEPRGVVISPGPGAPASAGVSTSLARLAPPDLPILGVCLGHQCLAEDLGGRVCASPQPTHGRASRVVHRGTGIFSGLPSPFRAGRYHSLTVAPGSLPDTLSEEAWTEEGELMAFRHRTRPVWGVQFHPESILTEWGGRLLENFLALTRSPTAPGGPTPRIGAGDV